MSNKILIFGDICPDNDYRSLFDNNKNLAFSNEIVNEIKSASLTIANLECPVTDTNNAIVKCGPSLKANYSDAERIKALGFDCVSLANNHILDYDIQGVNDTFKACNDSELKFVGAGQNKEDARKPIILDVSGKKIGLISFAEEEFNIAGDSTPGANMFDPYTSFDDVSALKKQCDYVIVLYHGGIEYYKYPSLLLRKKCRKFASSGANLILCQHSHCIGTFEEFKDCTIVYGQGNSLFGYRDGDDSWNEGFLVEVDTDTFDVSFKLMNATKDGIVFASDENHKARFDEMVEDSKKLDDKEFLKQSWIEFSMKKEALNMPLLLGKSITFIRINRILKNLLIKLFVSKRAKMTTMNLLRCDAHREVMQTILEQNVYNEK